MPLEIMNEQGLTGYISISRKIGFVATICIVILSLNSCSQLTYPQVSTVPTPAQDIVLHQSFSSAVFTDLPEGMGSGWGIGFVRPEHLSISPFDRPQTEEFRLSVGETFSPYLVLASNIDEPMNVLITVLLDYQQVPFELDGKTGTLHKLALSSSVNVNLPMKLTIDQLGAHDLIVIAFADPDYHPLDSEARLLDLQPALAGRRAVVVVGDDESPYKDLPPDMAGELIPESNSDYLRVALANLPDVQTGVPPGDRQFTVTSVNRNEDFSFQVIAKNEDEEHVEYAMVTFLDFRQLVLDEDGVLVSSLDPGEEATFDSSVFISDIVDIHELQVVYITDPYKSILRDKVTTAFVFGSVRVGIQVP